MGMNFRKTYAGSTRIHFVRSEKYHHMPSTSPGASERLKVALMGVSTPKMGADTFPLYSCTQDESAKTPAATPLALVGRVLLDAPGAKTPLRLKKPSRTLPVEMSPGSNWPGVLRR
jgi:hypothetical protein